MVQRLLGCAMGQTVSDSVAVLFPVLLHSPVLPLS